MRGRPKAELVLFEAEHERLTALTLRRKTAQALALRARIALACAQGVDNKVVASRQRVTPQTVSKWRARFVEHRLDGLLDTPRPGAPRTIDDTRVDAVIAKTLEEVPSGATHWRTRTMAREASLSQTAVSRIWRAFGLQPHRQETFKLSTDPLFVEKVRTQPLLPLAPGSLSGAPMTTSATARRRCLRRWTLPPARSSGTSIVGIAAASSCSSCEVHPSRNTSLYSRTRAGHQALHQDQQRRSEAVRLVEIR